jgi:exocyst complex component 4
LAQTTLFTLRLELRCRVIHFLNQTIREGNFGLTEDEVEEEELDPTIVELCKDLVSFENLLSATLEIQESKFILSELSCLIDQTLLSLACTITLFTSPSLGKLRRIILTVSQNLKHFIPQPQDALLNRSLEYFFLFSLGPAQFIQ